MAVNPSRCRPAGAGFALGLAAGALAALIVRRRLWTPMRMPFAGRWRRALAERHGDAEAARLLSRAQARYRELYPQRPRPASPALRFHLERLLLPGLALYQTLLDEIGDKQAVVAEMEQLVASAVADVRRIMPLLGRLPDPFGFFRWAEPLVVRLGFPPEGWDMVAIEDCEDCIAFDIRRCFYLDTLTAYGTPELTPAFCSVDDVAFGALPPSITWERATTLGRGGERCDFRWRRGTSGPR